MNECFCFKLPFDTFSDLARNSKNYHTLLIPPRNKTWRGLEEETVVVRCSMNNPVSEPNEIGKCNNMWSVRRSRHYNLTVCLLSIHLLSTSHRSSLSIAARSYRKRRVVASSLRITECMRLLTAIISAPKSATFFSDIPSTVASVARSVGRLTASCRSTCAPSTLYGGSPSRLAIPDRNLYYRRNETPHTKHETQRIWHEDVQYVKHDWSS